MALRKCCRSLLNVSTADGCIVRGAYSACKSTASLKTIPCPPRKCPTTPLQTKPTASNDHLVVRDQDQREWEDEEIGDGRASIISHITRMGGE